ncbi:MAG TPA: hypothetical protein VKV40_18515 [Ktedonobacteraceae bacterium]|nr:hypothetical protein [Ktedonobacteraceae bacterium]
MHQNLEFTHMIVRYDRLDLGLAVVVGYATSQQEAEMLLQAFCWLAPHFAPTALYAIREVRAASLYQKVLEG